MVLKIAGLGFILNRGSYLRDSWNILDFVIVTTGYIPILMPAGQGFSLNSLRSLRVLRPLRTISSSKKLKTLLSTVVNAIPNIAEILVILAFFY